MVAALCVHCFQRSIVCTYAACEHKPFRHICFQLQLGDCSFLLSSTAIIPVDKHLQVIDNLGTRIRTASGFNVHFGDSVHSAPRVTLQEVVGIHFLPHITGQFPIPVHVDKAEELVLTRADGRVPEAFAAFIVFPSGTGGNDARVNSSTAHIE